MGDVAGGRVGGKGGCHILLDAVPALHGFSGGRRPHQKKCGWFGVSFLCHITNRLKKAAS